MWEALPGQKKKKPSTLNVCKDVLYCYAVHTGNFQGFRKVW